MDLLPTAEDIPFSTDADGVVRVSRTRVTLDTIVQAFADGATADEIAHQYPSVPFADIFLVIGYYLRHRAEVDAYLRERRDLAGHIRQQTELRHDPTGMRERLLNRRASSRS
jgi:uncharacterized protein (DUF433 family)